MAKERIDRDDEDLVRLYLTDIGQYLLLTKDDEVRLAKAIEEGKAADDIINTVEAYAPGFRASVLGRQILSPKGLERKFGLVSGDIMHGNMSLDQLWSARPILGHGAYRGPLKGLYMCGAGSHPGGGVTGAPGHNCASEVLADRSILKRMFG